MSLFEKKKEKNEEKSNYCCGKPIEGVCCIKVLSSGCKNCHAMYENAQSAVKAAGLGIEVEYITDLQKVMEYGMMSMPALVINEHVVTAGKILKPGDIEELIMKTR